MDDLHDVDTYRGDFFDVSYMWTFASLEKDIINATNNIDLKTVIKEVNRIRDECDSKTTEIIKKKTCHFYNMILLFN